MNFISPDVHRFVRKKLAFREEGALYDEQRLSSNALSSSPAVFNIFGPLALDLDLATSVFRRLLPAYVMSVEGFMFEHSPGRHDPLYNADGTAVDLAVNCTTPEGETLRIFVEFKLSETLDSGPIAQDRPRYAEASREVRVFRDPDSTALRMLPLEQLWREAMLGQLSVDRGLVQKGVFVAIAPRLNRHAHQAFAAFADELIEEGHRDDKRISFVSLTLETVIEAIRECSATELANALWARYGDFDRVAQVVMDEIDAAAPDQSTNSVEIDKPRALISSATVPARPKPSPSSARRRRAVKTKVKQGQPDALPQTPYRRSPAAATCQWSARRAGSLSGGKTVSG